MRWFKRSVAVHTGSSASAKLLLLAVVSTSIAVLGGQWLVWSLYSSSVQQGESLAGSGNALDASTAPLVVAVGKTPGGPSEWVTYAAVFAQLKQNVARPVSVQYVPDTASMESGIASGTVDVAISRIISYLELADRGLVKLVAAPIVAGQPQDTAVLVVLADSKYDSLEDLRGARLLLAPESLAGWAYPYWELEQRGLDASTFFGSTEVGGSQDQNLGRLASGDGDVTGVQKSALLSREPGTYRVIATSPPFGAPPVIARAELDPELLGEIRSSLLDTDPATLPEGSVLTGFRAVKDEEYDFMRELLPYMERPVSNRDGVSP